MHATDPYNVRERIVARDSYMVVCLENIKSVKGATARDVDTRSIAASRDRISRACIKT